MVDVAEDPFVPLPSRPGFDLEEFTRRFAGYHKLLSMLYLRALGLSGLEGFIVTRWSAEVEREVQDYCRRHGWGELLLRHDRRPEVPSAPRGGYLFKVSRFKEEMENYSKQQRILILFEPRSPYDDRYSMNFMFAPGEDTGVIEVVGPGFDASDLQRGDITPHEQVTIRLDNLARGFTSPSRVVIQRDVVDPTGYRKTVEQRLLKIARRHGLNDSPAAAQEFLQKRGKTLLTSHLDCYEPIPEELLKRYFSTICDVPQDLFGVSGRSGRCVISMSVLHPDDAFVFWDIVWPQLKYTF